MGKLYCMVIYGQMIRREVVKGGTLEKSELLGVKGDESEGEETGAI